MKIGFSRPRERNGRRGRLGLALSALLTGHVFLSPLALAEEAAKPAKEPHSLQTQKWFLDEAAQAVVGRVFGVEGQAGDIAYHEIELHQHTPSRSAVRSALIPGWGQVFNRQHLKGILLFSTVAGTAAASWALNRKADEAYDDYKGRGRRDDSTYDDYEKFKTQSYFFGGLAVFLWGINIIDAYRHAYNPLYTSEPSLQLTSRDGDPYLTWTKRFE